MFQNGLFLEKLYTNYRDIEVGAYLIDEDIIVSYDLCITQQEHMDEYINNPRWIFLGYGYCCNTTLDNRVSSDKEISAFFVRNGW